MTNKKKPAKKKKKTKRLDDMIKEISGATYPIDAAWTEMIRKGFSEANIKECQNFVFGRNKK